LRKRESPTKEELALNWFARIPEEDKALGLRLIEGSLLGAILPKFGFVFFPKSRNIPSLGHWI